MLEQIKSRRLTMSVEVFPPKYDGHLEEVIRPLRALSELNPVFTSVTYGANGKGSNKTADVASVAIDALGMNVLAHMTAVNLTKENLQSQIDVYRRKNVKNLLVLRGDLRDDSEFFDFRHADELALYIKKNYPDFTLFGACYPEKHPESPSVQADTDVIKRKIDAGVECFVSQLFLSNDYYFSFLDRMAKENIPSDMFIAGIMPLTQVSMLERTVKMCGATVPCAFKKIVELNHGDISVAGIDYAKEQIKGLIAGGVNSIHLYTMNKAEIAEKIFGTFFKEK